MKYTGIYLKRARIAGQLLRWVPFLRMAGLNGSIVRGEENDKSDIDFLIIAKAGRLYTARFFATAFIHLTGWRRYGNRIAGRICLNCYLSDKNPDIVPKNPQSRQRVARAYRYLIPLVEAGNTSGSFFEVNRWFDEELGFAKLEHRKYLRYYKSLRIKLIPTGAARPFRFLEIYLGGKFGNWVEKKLMNFQAWRILVAKKRGDETVATTTEIRLHPKKKKIQ